MRTLAAVGLGSNLGERAKNLDAGVLGVSSLDATRLLAVSTYIETAPVGDVEQGAFLNAAIIAETTLDARAFLEGLLAVEREHGRDRDKERRWGPRTLDLDLLLFGDRVIDEPGLVVPHPRLHERLFALRPLAQIGAGLVVPGTGATVGELCAQLGGKPAKGKYHGAQSKKPGAKKPGGDRRA